MANLDTDYFSGGSRLTPNDSAGEPDLARVLIEVVDELRAEVRALAAKLDADAGVTDTDYVATLDALVAASGLKTP